jgi:1,4-dihydroxy-2-naphthoate octaprenyltransferase
MGRPKHRPHHPYARTGLDQIFWLFFIGLGLFTLVIYLIDKFFSLAL